MDNGFGIWIDTVAELEVYAHSGKYLGWTRVKQNKLEFLDILVLLKGERV